jgi:hypothetical protein
MTRDDLDPALRWEGDDAPDAAAKKPAAPVAKEPQPSNAAESVVTRGTSSAFLVMYGVLAGIYLIYTIGWLVGMHHVVGSSSSTLSAISAAVAQGLALGSPALWFLTTLYLTRKRSSLSRLLALVSGLIVVLPWPFILLGA